MCIFYVCVCVCAVVLCGKKMYTYACGFMSICVYTCMETRVQCQMSSSVFMLSFKNLLNFIYLYVSVCHHALDHSVHVEVRGHISGDSSFHHLGMGAVD